MPPNCPGYRARYDGRGRALPPVLEIYRASARISLAVTAVIQVQPNNTARATARAAQFIETITPVLQNTEHLEEDLREIASRYVTTVFSPQVVQLRRLVVMESARFPEIARAYCEQAPGRMVSALASAFKRLGERGLLRLDDPRIAAMHFAGLIVMMPLDKTMFGGTFTPEELTTFAEAGVRAFLAAYGPTGS